MAPSLRSVSKRLPRETVIMEAALSANPLAFENCELQRKLGQVRRSARRAHSRCRKITRNYKDATTKLAEQKAANRKLRRRVKKLRARITVQEDLIAQKDQQLMVQAAFEDYQELELGAMKNSLKNKEEKLNIYIGAVQNMKQKIQDGIWKNGSTSDNANAVDVGPVPNIEMDH